VCIRSTSHPASAPSLVLYAIILGRKLAENLAYLLFLTGALTSGWQIGPHTAQCLSTYLHCLAAS
jgi:hypothetical protein